MMLIGCSKIMAIHRRAKRHEFAAEYAVCQRKCVTLRLTTAYINYEEMAEDIKLDND